MSVKPKKEPEIKPVKKPLIGYPIIEKLVESEEFDKVNESVSRCYDTLEAMLKNKTGGLKKQKAVRQALKAYDLTMDLVKELLTVKYQIMKEEAEKHQKK